MRTDAIILVAIALAGTSSAAAQRRAPGASGGGLWYSVGVAPGWARVTCDICAGRRKTQTLLSFGGAAYWYPNVQRGLYLRGGATLVMHRVNDGTDVVTSSGIGPQLGVGYEYRVSRGWRLAPFAHYSVGVFGGDVKFNGGQATGSATVSFLQVGASLTRSR